MDTAATCPWSKFAPSVESFCEERLCSWIVEPANTWSNIGYILVGLLILRANRGTGRNSLNLAGLTSILVGIGSTLFHATGSRIGEIVDLGAMYLISGLFIIFAVNRLKSVSTAVLSLSYAAITATSLTAMIIFHSSGIAIFVAHLVVAVLLELTLAYRFYATTSYKHLNLMVMAFALAYFMWYLDYHKIFCDPDNHWFGGHAGWHLINSTCLWNFYRYQEQFVARSRPY